MAHFYLLKKLNKTFRWLNRREATELDCWKICDNFNIVVRFAPLVVRGYYGKTIIRNKKRYFILLDDKLQGIELVLAFLHEIGHALLHEPKTNLEVLYSKRESVIYTKQETEADVFMLLAILPFQRFLELKAMPQEELHPFTIELLKRREILHVKIKNEDLKVLQQKRG